MLQCSMLGAATLPHSAATLLKHCNTCLSMPRVSQCCNAAWYMVHPACLVISATTLPSAAILQHNTCTVCLSALLQLTLSVCCTIAATLHLSMCCNAAASACYAATLRCISVHAATFLQHACMQVCLTAWRPHCMLSPVQCLCAVSN